MFPLSRPQDSAQLAEVLSDLGYEHSRDAGSSRISTRVCHPDASSGSRNLVARDAADRISLTCYSNQCQPKHIIRNLSRLNIQLPGGPPFTGNSQNYRPAITRIDQIKQVQRSLGKRCPVDDCGATLHAEAPDSSLGFKIHCTQGCSWESILDACIDHDLAISQGFIHRHTAGGHLRVTITHGYHGRYRDKFTPPRRALTPALWSTPRTGQILLIVSDEIQAAALASNPDLPAEYIPTAIAAAPRYADLADFRNLQHLKALAWPTNHPQHLAASQVALTIAAQDGLQLLGTVTSTNPRNLRPLSPATLTCNEQLQHLAQPPQLPPPD